MKPEAEKLLAVLSEREACARLAAKCQTGADAADAIRQLPIDTEHGVLLALTDLGELEVDLLLGLADRAEETPQDAALRLFKRAIRAATKEELDNGLDRE